MKHVLFLACAALCACSPASPDATASAAAQVDVPAASAPNASAPSASQPAVPAAPVKEMPVLRFGLAADGATPALAVERTEPSPCGPVARVRTDRIPWADPALVPDVVVEFDAGGRALKKWGKAYEAEVVGLDGDRLRFRAETGTFWTDPSGLVEVADARVAVRDASVAEPYTREATAIDCPALDAFKGADALHCHRVRDAAGGERLIAFEGVCS